MIRKRLRRIAKVLGVVVALLLVLVAALPALLSTSAARRTVLARVNPHVGGELTIQRWSFGWRSGVRIEQLTFVDGEGRFGATLDRFNMSGGLLKLLGKTKNLGNVDVSGLHGWCDLDRLEAAEAAGVPAPAGRPTPADKHSATSKKPDAPAKPVDVPTVAKLRAPLPLDVIAKLTLKDIRVEARKTGQSATTLLLDGTLDCASLKQPVRFAFAADCRAADARPAASRGPGLKLEGSAQLLKDGVLDPAALVASIAFGADGFDLGGLAAARAFAPTLPAIGGLCDSALQIQVNGLRDMRAAGNLQLRNLDVKGGVLGADHLQLEEVRLDLDVARKGWNLDVQQLSLRSAPATFKAVGTLATAAGATYPTGQITMLGDVNLADVAARLPHTLKLPEAVQVQGGVFHLEGKAEGRGDALRLRAKASLRDLRGRQGELAFQQATPIDLSASAVLTAAGPVIESFDLQAGFASASGGGSATGAIFQVNADLGAAAREIDRVVGLGALGVSGQLRAKLQADLQAADAPRVDVDLSLRGLSVIGLSQWEGLASVPDFSGEWGMRASLALGQDGRMALKGTLLGNALELRGGALGSDQPRIASLRVDLDAARAGERIDIRSFDVESPLVSASVSGRVESVTGMVYPRMAVDAHVKADLVSLAQAFPATLHLQPGLQIQGGTGTLHSAVQADGAVLGWDARLVLSPLAATRGGQELRLAEAVTVETRGNLNASGPKVEMLRITSGFAQIEAAGDLAKADVKVQANLDKAMTEVGQFVDLGKLRLGGQLGATVALSSPSPSERKFGFDAHVDNLMLGGVAPETLRREQVRAAGDAVLLMAETGKLTGLRAVTLRVDGLPIGLHGRVAQVALADAATGQGLQVTDAELGVEGTMEALLAFCREAGLVKGDIPLTGPLTLETRLTSNADGVELQAFKFVS
ncbi:MAG: hypothetical protein O3B24_04075 [Verrucomicrobia bacterium]|nr:hypothetical protein [Verrucomicrobiota bacterium]